MSTTEFDRTQAPVSTRRHLVYWIGPGLLLAALVLAYFSGPSLLSSIVAPLANREFGLLENLQLVLIAVSIWAGRIGFSRAQSAFEKALFAVVMLASSLVLLEEMDYGRHFWNLAHGVASSGPPVNLHNIGGNTEALKLVSEIVIVVFFVVLPLVRRWIGYPPLRYFVGDPMLAATAAAAFLVSALAHALNDMGLNPNGALAGNLSEFRETSTYYMIAIYLADLAMHRRWPGLRSAG